jgi:glycosyltransferase involved in cell wall biosynthesis
MLKLLYLSGAPRVSTRDNAEASGARAHILGMINGFQECGFQVDEFIIGNHTPTSWSNSGSERILTKSVLFRLIADLVRIVFSYFNKRKAENIYNGNYNYVYERFAAFQNLGTAFQKKGIKWILETNSPLFYEASEERKSIVLVNLCKSLELNAYKNCDHIVCVTKELKEIISSLPGVRSEKILVIPNGVDTNRFNPLTTIPFKVSDKFTIGFVGILAPWCGVDILLEAIKELESYNLPIHVVIVGDGIMKQKFQALTQELNITKQVTFVGHVDWAKVPSYISGFDIAYSGQTNLQIGKMYHSPLKIYEYMAMGKPVIASAFEDAERMIKNGFNGFLFTSGNVQQLSAVISEAYINNELLTPKRSEEIRLKIVNEHSWQSRTRSLLAALN